MKKYYLLTFGCQMQKTDSERIISFLEKEKFLPAKKEDEADLFLVNMCSVRQSAVDRVYGLSKKFKMIKIKKPNLKTLLTGCFSLKDAQKLKKIFNFILPIKSLPCWSNILKKKNFYLIFDQRNKNFLKKYKFSYLKIVPKYSKNFSVFIPISTGCDNFCSFCIVPFVRGPLICRSHQEILKETKKAVKSGAKEIWFLGQNVNDYLSPADKKINFAKLLKLANKINGNFWIRFTSPHPKNFTDELINTMAKCQKITPYLNLPLQSGDDKILKKMNRGYSSEEYKNLVDKIRKKFKNFRKGLEKDITISTDIIVGFPGETKKQFNNTLKIFKEIKFDMAYIAKFSPRPGTVTEKLKDNVTENEKERRWKILNRELKKIAIFKNKKFIGKKILVLAETEKNGFLFGKSRHYKTVKFPGEKCLIGEFIKVKIEKVTSFGLEGIIAK